jgi:hypothetical protein
METEYLADNNEKLTVTLAHFLTSRELPLPLVVQN